MYSKLPSSRFSIQPQDVEEHNPPDLFKFTELFRIYQSKEIFNKENDNDYSALSLLDKNTKEHGMGRGAVGI